MNYFMLIKITTEGVSSGGGAAEGWAGPERNFWSDGVSPYLDWGGSYTGVYILQNPLRCAVKIYALHCM